LVNLELECTIIAPLVRVRHCQQAYSFYYQVPPTGLEPATSRLGRLLVYIRSKYYDSNNLSSDQNRFANLYQFVVNFYLQKICPT